MHGERLGVLIISLSKRIQVMRIIVHVHMDAFYAAVEELLDRRLRDLAPVDAELAQATAVLYGGCIGAAQVQLFCQIQRQFLRALRFYDHAILLEGKTVPLLQLLI